MVRAATGPLLHDVTQLRAEHRRHRAIKHAHDGRGLAHKPPFVGRAFRETQLLDPRRRQAQPVTENDAHVIVKLSEIGLTDPLHTGLTTGSRPSSWGSIGRLFVNLTIPVPH